MLKKLFLGALFLGLSTVLVVGAVNRTTAKTTDLNSTHEVGGQGRNLAGNEQWVSNGQGQGQGRMAESGLSQGQLRSDGQGLNAQPQGRGGNAGSEGNTAAGSGQGQQGGGQGQQGSGQGQQGNGQGRQDNSQGQQGNSQGRGNGGGDAVAWQILEGDVVAVDEESLTLMTAEGEVEVADRGWRFAQEQGFTAQVGERVQLQGFLENGELEVGGLMNLSTLEQVQVREQTGRPLWAGGGGNYGEVAPGSPQVPQPMAESEDHQWQALKGLVIAVDAEQMTVATGAGHIEVVDRPWDFALQQGFVAQVGDQVSLMGFDEAGTFEVGQLINETTGQQVQIREESGRPLWAGGGRGRAF